MKSSTLVLLFFLALVLFYPKKENYGDLYNINRPENAELLIIQLLAQFVKIKQTPHIVLPITTFNPLSAACAPPAK